MILVKVAKKENEYQKITLTGHAMYADYGKDIVCAAVSSIATTTINAILSLEKENMTYKKTKTGLEIKVKKSSTTNQKLLENMVLMLKELELEYPKNIEVR